MEPSSSSVLADSMPYRTHGLDELSCDLHRAAAATSSCIECSAMLCPLCGFGSRCTKCRGRKARRRLAIAIAIGVGLVATFALVVITARRARSPEVAFHEHRVAEARDQAMAHPCDAHRLMNVITRRTQPMGFAPDDLEGAWSLGQNATVRMEALRVHLAATCPPMPIGFLGVAADVALELEDFTLARTLADRVVQRLNAGVDRNERWGAYAIVEQVGMALHDAALLRFAREGFQSIRPTHTYAEYLAQHP
jgi:hypothetical protein